MATPDTSSERAGWYLVALMALVVPLLILVALFFPTRHTATEPAGLTPSPAAVIEGIDLRSRLVVEPVPVEVAGTSERRENITTDIGEAVSIVREPDTAEGPAESTREPSGGEAERPASSE